MNSIEHQYKIFAFRAIDEPELCKQYIEGHIKVLTDYGIANITSNNNSWVTNPNIYCLGLWSESKELLGGIRIQLADGKNLLPIEEAIGYMENDIYNIVKTYALNGGIGELSGLWIDNRLRGLGIGWYMVRAAIASSSQLNFKTMIGICGDVTLTMFNNVGFVVDKSIGDNGQFYYPNEDLIAHVVGILNAITLESAIEYDKDIMVSLRKDSQQQRIENDTDTEVCINYNLIYPKVVSIDFSNEVSNIKSINK
ncbi:MAG: hypothetical protein COA97_05980 [Flavobacteriales bacterium]|nr:MAG: hypothetical protein COA97_05980 [Flavobacteriales bacterium]